MRRERAGWRAEGLLIWNFPFHHLLPFGPHPFLTLTSNLRFKNCRPAGSSLKKGRGGTAEEKEPEIRPV